jgi:ribokinase
MNPRIVVVGSLNADLVVGVSRFPAPGETLSGGRFDVFPGGKGGNQAAAAARLGGHVAMVGQVGADSQGDWLRRSLAETGADVTMVATDERVSSGVALITTDAGGQNTIVVVAGANGTFEPGRLGPAVTRIRAARVVMLQLEIPLQTVERAAAEARSAGALVLLDPAPPSWPCLPAIRRRRCRMTMSKGSHAACSRVARRMSSSSSARAERGSSRQT